MLFHYATNPNTPFVVTEMTFSELRDKTEDELEVMLVHLRSDSSRNSLMERESHVSIPGLKLFL